MKKTTGLLCSIMAFNAFAETDTMIVFDASGSMWGQIEGKTKIEIAKAAINNISDGFAADQVVGLMAYGHRNKGDCADIELLVSPAKGVVSDIVSQTMALQPKGKTPLSAAVKMAAEHLKYTENKAVVVLITDGVANSILCEYYYEVAMPFHMNTSFILFSRKWVCLNLL